ncbi:MAG: dihydrolipoyllysine-residue acetyltransferase [Gammaproteobacteria bacterium]
MSEETKVLVPDIGDFDEVDVIELLVEVGATVAVEDPLVTLESDKATMDIPAPYAGKVLDICVAVGDKVSEGSLLVTLQTTQAEVDMETGESRSAPPQPVPAAGTRSVPSHEEVPPESSNVEHTSAPIEVTIPDIGDFEEVDVIEILVSTGTNVAAEDPLITLESDKATMDIPAPVAGEVVSINVNLGDKVSEGHVFAVIKPSGEIPNVAPPTTAPTQTIPQDAANEPTEPTPKPTRPAQQPSEQSATSRVYASPSVRKFARELGVDLSDVSGSGRKGRILKSDVKGFVKSNIGRGDGLTVPRGPDIDFTKFGEIETVELSKIRRLTGENLHRSWITVPHVTQFDEADITELEDFRQAQLEKAADSGAKLTLMAFLMKACVTVLGKYPDFNASLSPDGQSLIRKKYFNIGMAVNTDAGLLVPVIKNVDQKGLYAIAREIRELAVKARDRKLAPTEMQGACFTLSNLGGIAGTGFTPIVNPPEVAILGISPAIMKPVYIEEEFQPRLMLPLSLSYDHRVIDGVAGAMFTRELSNVLNDIRQILL